MSDVFGSIYERRSWNPRQGTRSGPGSSVEATTQLRFTLPGLLRLGSIRSVLDAACGESEWMPELPGYVGCDIVPEAVEAARVRFPAREFFVADIRHDLLPQVDAVLCRDVMMHMSLADGLATLANLRTTNARWLLATTFLEGENVEITTGRFYRINLEREPFCLRPEMLLPDTWRWPDKRLAVYSVF